MIVKRLFLVLGAFDSWYWFVEERFLDIFGSETLLEFFRLFLCLFSSDIHLFILFFLVCVNCLWVIFICVFIVLYILIVCLVGVRASVVIYYLYLNFRSLVMFFYFL